MKSLKYYDSDIFKFLSIDLDDVLKAEWVEQTNYRQKRQAWIILKPGAKEKYESPEAGHLVPEEEEDEEGNTYDNTDILDNLINSCRIQLQWQLYTVEVEISTLDYEYMGGSQRSYAYTVPSFTTRHSIPVWESFQWNYPDYDAIPLPKYKFDYSFVGRWFVPHERGVAPTGWVYQLYEGEIITEINFENQITNAKMYLQ